MQIVAKYSMVIGVPWVKGTVKVCEACLATEQDYETSHKNLTKGTQ